jgi:hypothetical protein
MDTQSHYVGYQNGDDYWATYLYANDAPESRIPRLAMVMGHIQAKLEQESPDLKAIDYIDNMYDEAGSLRVTIRSEMANQVPQSLFSAVLQAWEGVAQEERTKVSFNFSEVEDST